MRFAILITLAILLQATGSAGDGSRAAQGRGLGEAPFTLDIETPTGGDRCMDLEYDGAHYRATGEDGQITGVTYGSLAIDTPVFASWRGGTLHFYLSAGTENANRFYGIFGSASGNSPGTPLPGGSVTLPINWDFFTDLLYGFMLPGFLGYLDSQGCADVPLTLAPFDLVDNALLTFAYALRGPPWDMASNYVTLQVKADYRHDDGSTEGAVMTMVGGDLCRMHGFDTLGGGSDTIHAVSVAWGSAMFPGYYPGNGTPSKVFVWDDPNDDGNPNDCVLLGGKDTVVQNVDTDLLTEVALDAPVTVNGVFFVGTVIHYPPGSSVLGVDADSPYGQSGWIGGNTSGNFDPVNMSGNFFYEMGSIGFPGCFLLRGIP